MAESNINQNTSDTLSKDVSMDQLKNFSFSTAWSSIEREPRQAEGEFRRKRQPDRRFNTRKLQAEGQSRGFSQERSRSPQSGEQRYSGETRDFSPRFQKSQPFHPTVEVAFYPEEAPFQTLIQALKVSGRSYPLFEIAQLILEKPERFVVAVTPKASTQPNAPKSNLFVCIPAGIPFETEESALHYALKHHLDTFFTIETVECEAPKGNFIFVYRDPKTQSLITPPNYHKAQSLLNDFHQSHAPVVPFDRFVANLEKASGPETIEAWTQQMSRISAYRLKGEGESLPIFDSLQGAHHYLMTHCKDKLVKTVKSCRFSGKQAEALPNNDLRQSIETVLELQRRFPLDTANHLRGRMRRLGFCLFKNSSITYLSSIKRRARTPGLLFSDSIQKLVEFLETHSEVSIQALTEQFLQISKPAEGASLSTEDNQRIKATMQDLRWLAREGYVTEFNDGRLSLSPLATSPEAKAIEKDNEPTQQSSTPTDTCAVCETSPEEREEDSHTVAPEIPSAEPKKGSEE